MMMIIKQAKRLGVQVLPSDNPKKKIEVYDKNGIFITYAGGTGYKDFLPILLKRDWNMLIEAEHYTKNATRKIGTRSVQPVITPTNFFGRIKIIK